MADNTDLIKLLSQWANNGGTNAPNNVPQSSSAQGYSNSVDSLSGGNNNGNVNRVPADANLNGPSSPDYGSILNSLIQKGLEASGGTDSQQNKLPPAHQAAIDGALQGIKKAASEAASTGGLPAANHIIDLANSSIGQNFGGQQPSPLDMNSLIQKSPLMQNNGQSNNIEQQALNIVKPANSFFGKLMENLGNTGIINAQKLQNLASAQKIVAGQPGEIGLPQAQIEQTKALRDQVQQQIQGLTPAQQAEAIGNYNSSLINQHNELQKGVTDQITSTATAIDQLVKNTPLLDKAPGSPYYDTLKALQNRLTGLSNQGKDVVQSFKDLQLTNPNSKGLSSNSGIQRFNVNGITYNIPANKVDAFKKAKGL